MIVQGLFPIQHSLSHMSIRLLNLPNEVLFQIISVTANADLDNFTLSCKTVRNLGAQTLREHRARKKLYEHIIYGDPDKNRKSTTWKHPTLMLRDLIDTDLLYYPLRLSIADHDHYGVGWGDGNWDDGRVYEDSGVDQDDHYSEVDRVLESFPKDLGPMVRACPYLGDDQDILTGILEEGYIGATLGFLLTLLPNLMILNVRDYSTISDGAENLNLIIENILKVGYSSMFTMVDPRPLTKLERVTFTRSDEGVAGDPWDLSMYAPLYYLPSMRFWWAQYICPERETWHFPGLCSSIERLSLNESEVDVISLNTYLKDTKHLRHFRCDVGGSGMHHIACSYRDIVQRLLRYTTHSLRSLELGNDGCRPDLARAGGHFLGSLKAFQALQRIKVQASMFIKPFEKLDPGTITVKPGNPRKLVDMLPASAIRIVFASESLPEDEYGVDEDVAIAILKDLPEKRALLPKLENVEFHYKGGDDTEVDGALWRACRVAGVEISDELGILN